MLQECTFTVHISKYRSYFHMTKHLSEKKPYNSATNLSLRLIKVYISTE
jgi:hypothetical protein